MAHTVERPQRRQRWGRRRFRALLADRLRPLRLRVATGAASPEGLRPETVGQLGDALESEARRRLRARMAHVDRTLWRACTKHMETSWEARR